MFDVKTLRGNLIVRLPFARPVFDWTGVAPTFMEMLWSALQSTLVVQPSDFSVSAPQKLSDVQARFNLYGGPNNITLWADKITFEFVNLTPSDYTFVLKIIQQVHDALPTHFPNLEYFRVEVHSMRHLQFTQPDQIEAYLENFHPGNVENAFATFAPIVCEPVARFDVRNHDNMWQCKFGVERSLLDANAIFVDLYITLQNQSNQTTFEEKANLAGTVASKCYDALGIHELSNA